MARPRKQAFERRDEVIRARVTLAEKLFIEEQAEAAGISTAEYIRRRTLKLPVQPRPSRVDDALIWELNRIGVNINQLAHAANVGRTLPNLWETAAQELHAALEIVIESYDSEAS